MSLFGHVVGFASRNAPPSRTKILSRFLPAMLSPFGGRVLLFYGHVGAILRPTSAILVFVLKAIWGHFGPCCFGIACQKQPKDTPPKRSPLALKARQNQIKNCPKTQKLRQNANLHGSKGKTKPKIHPISTFKTHPRWPCSHKIKAPPQRQQRHEHTLRRQSSAGGFEFI